MSDSSTNHASISRILDELDHILDIKIGPADMVNNVLTNTEVSIDKSSAKNSTEFQQQFNCNNVCDLFCDYKATSKQGLKVHVKKKHTGQKEEEKVGETIKNEAK